MFGQGQKLCRDDFDDLRPVYWLAVLDNMLSNIVSILVSDEH